MEIQYPEKSVPDLLKYLPAVVLAGVSAVVLLWAAFGFYMVSPGEVGVVRRFGKEVRKSEPGLRYRIPWPVEQVNIVNIERVRRAEMGFRSVESALGLTQKRVPEEALMLTGDENIVEAQVIVQYQVKDPSLYLFQVYQPDEVLRTSAEVALRSMVGNTTIDDILTVGREKVQLETQTFLQRLLDNYRTGLRVTEVRLQVVDPPDQVKDAFHEVVRAREDREKLINQAQGYNEDIIPKARGKAQQMIREAEGYQKERVLRAEGDAARFTALAEEYEKAKKVTRARLYLEAMERLLARVKKLMIDSKVTDKFSPLLPIGDFRLKETNSLSKGDG